MYEWDRPFYHQSNYKSVGAGCTEPLLEIVFIPLHHFYTILS